MTHAEMLAVIQHHADGGDVEYKNKHRVDGWKNTEEPPLWDFSSSDYRIKEKPKTKTVYEWMFRLTSTNAWELVKDLWTEEEASHYLGTFIYQKTGRSWEVLND